MTENIYIDFATLKALMRDIFIGAGVPPADAEICADVLICADRLGIDSLHVLQRSRAAYAPCSCVEAAGRCSFSPGSPAHGPCPVSRGGRSCA